MINKETVATQSSDEDVVLSVRNVSKRFCRDLKRSLSYGIQDVFSELLGIRKEAEKLRPKEFWALNDVSFDLRKGEAVGLIGKNGSGKSTVLRVIAGLIKPDKGSVEINGLVAPLIALGAGFNPILTGRENVYANMSILGLSKEKIDNQFDKVLDFAEIGDAIDSPLQSYSSGMAARLGFACAIHAEPDILLIDEVLAVGDARFRAKCHRKLNDLRKQGVSFILVTHNSQTILNICDTAVYLSRGNLVAAGNTESVMKLYEDELFFNGAPKEVGRVDLPEKKEEDSSGIDILSLFFRDGDGNIVESPTSGMRAYFCAECKAHKNATNIGLSFAIREIAGEGDITLLLSSFNDNKSFEVSPGIFELQIEMPYLCLKPGSYTMKVFIKDGALGTLDFVEPFNFTVGSKESMSYCLFYQPRDWKIKQ